MKKLKVLKKLLESIQKSLTEDFINDLKKLKVKFPSDDTLYDIIDGLSLRLGLLPSITLDLNDEHILGKLVYYISILGYPIKKDELIKKSSITKEEIKKAIEKRFFKELTTNEKKDTVTIASSPIEDLIKYLEVLGIENKKIK